MASARTSPKKPKGTDTSAAAGGEAQPAPRPGLRERKKIQTRQAIRHAAYRLFTEQGYDATPVDQIAEQAEVSPSTVFRYFPTKEDIVLTDEYDPLMESALLARPADEPPVTALRSAILSLLAEAYHDNPEEAHLRVRLAAEVPAIRARMTESTSVTGVVLARALAKRTGRDADDLELQVLTGALVGGLMQAMLHWAEHDADRPAAAEEHPRPTDRSAADRSADGRSADGRSADDRSADEADLMTTLEHAIDLLQRGLTL